MTDRGPQSGTGLYAAMLGILVLASFFAVLGNAPLFDVDEGAFSEATREMAASGNYLTTYLNGAPRFDKPVLIYWMQLLSIKTFGLNEFGLRFPSALFAGGWAMAMFFFARREFSQREAFLGSAMLVLSLQVTIIAKAAIADALLNFFLALTMLASCDITGQAPAGCCLSLLQPWGSACSQRGLSHFLYPLPSPFSSICRNFD